MGTAEKADDVFLWQKLDKAAVSSSYVVFVRNKSFKDLEHSQAVTKIWQSEPNYAENAALHRLASFGKLELHLIFFFHVKFKK